MKILFTICGRAGSKGIKSKNVRDFDGKPLVYYSLSALDLYIKSKGILLSGDTGTSDAQRDVCDVVLSTDSPELIRLIEENPFFKVDVIDRSASLSTDTAAKKDVIWDCLLKMEEKNACTYDVVVDLDITSPLRTVADIGNLIETHMRTGADITYSVTDSRRNPYFNQVIRTDEGYKIAVPSGFTARQQAPEVYDMNASLYAYRPDHLKSGGGFDGGYYEAIRMYDTAVLDLDHESDFELMEVIARYLYDRKPEFAEVYRNIP